MPFFAVNNENSRPVKPCKGITGECAAYIVLTIVLLNMLEVGWVVDDMEAEERNCHFVGRSVSLIKRVPGLATGSAVGSEFLNTAFKGLALWTCDPFRVGRGGRPDAPVAASPAEPCSDDEYSMLLHFAFENCTGGLHVTASRRTSVAYSTTAIIGICLRISGCWSRAPMLLGLSQSMLTVVDEDDRMVHLRKYELS